MAYDHCVSFRAFCSNFVKSLIFIAILAWMCQGRSAVHAEDARAKAADEITLDEIARRLTEWRSSFVNLRVVWELRSLPEADEAVEQWPAAPDPAAGSLFSREEWIWADHGLDLHEDWSFFYEDGSSKVHFIEAFNGPKGLVFRASFRRPQQGPEEFPHLLLQGLGTGKPISRLEHAPMEGLYWPGFARWLPEMFSIWDWKFEEIENISGERCARVAAEWPNLAGAVETLWLDLNHDCLVRRKRRPPTPEMLGGDFIVDEFQQLEGGIWFPKRGRIQLGASPHENHLFTVTAAAINQSLDLSRFDPPEPAVGTIVDDHGRVYKHGVSAVQAGQAVRSNTAGADATTKHTASVRSAVPPTLISWFWSSLALLTISVLLVVAGFWFSRRKQERQ